MNLYRKLGLARLMDVADDGQGGGGGGGTDDGQGGDGGQGGDEGGKGSAGDNGGQGGKQTGPTDAEAKLLKEVMDKKASLKKANDELAQATERLKQFDGIDPEEVRKLLADRKKAEEDQLAAKGEWERLKQRMAEEHGNEVKTIKEQLEARTKEIQERDRMINELTIGNAFGTSKYVSDELTLTPAKARMIYGDHFDFVDGKVVGFDKPRGAANRTQYVDGKGDPIAFDEAMKKIIDADPDRDELVKSRMKKGADSGSQKGEPPKKAAPELRGVGRIAAGLKNGVAK